jgi:putative transcriptional regulator
MNRDTAILTNQFLIAMPGMTDPHFARTVILLCQYGSQGALGIIINRPSELKLGDIMKQMDIQVKKPEIADLPVFFGGPVQPERGFILHEPVTVWGSTLQVSENFALTTSRDILDAIARGEGPQRVLVALGYAGWGEGQLEREIMENAWLNVPADSAVLFDYPPTQRWKAAAGLVGIDISQLTHRFGHA